jgi:putative transposase
MESAGNVTGVVISLHARGMSTREIEDHVRKTYGIQVSPHCICRATGQLQRQTAGCQNRPLERICPIVFMDRLRVSIRMEKGVLKKSIHALLGLGVSGRQEVLGLWIEETQGPRFWMNVLEELKARGLDDILVLCSNGAPGLDEAVRAVFPQTEVRLCIAHQIRDCTKFVCFEDRRSFCAAMRRVYTAPTIEAAGVALERLRQIPASWRSHWDGLKEFFKYPVEFRRLVYTANGIESLHAQMRKNIGIHRIFTDDDAAIETLFLNVRHFSNCWSHRPGWDRAIEQLTVMFGNRLKPEAVGGV